LTPEIAANTRIRAAAGAGLRGWLGTLAPSLGDVLFVSMFVWLFAAGNGWSGLLADGDTGWHIRNGENILRRGCVPHADWFSFGAQHHAWFAWEWLADVVFAVLHGGAGLKGVVFFSGVLIAATQYVVFRHALWRGANPLIAISAALAGANAASVHYLARPHVFTMFFFAASAWLLDRDRAGRTGLIWMLPGAVAIWTNLHGGFLAVFTLLGARVLECAIVRSQRMNLHRMCALAAACAGSTILNPYGWRLYQHLWSYLGSSWIRDSVEEFQSPRFRSESMLWFELLLVAGIAMVPGLIRRSRIADAALILIWAHAALTSVRHVPLYVIVSLPVIASELQRWLSLATVKRKSPLAILGELGSEWSGNARKLTRAPAAVLIGIFVFLPPSAWPNDFPERIFPVRLVSRNQTLLTSGAQPVRIFSTDQWSDYLIWRFHPAAETYFDGRSDFFADWRGESYRALMEARPGSMDILDREHVRFVLLPVRWPLATLMRANPAWRVRDEDASAVLLERRD
jgi:hypothetical protein